MVERGFDELKEPMELDKVREIREALLHQLHYAVGIGNAHVMKHGNDPYLVVFEPIIPTSFRGLEVKVLKSTRVLSE